MKALTLLLGAGLVFYAATCYAALSEEKPLSLAAQTASTSIVLAFGLVFIGLAARTNRK